MDLLGHVCSKKVTASSVEKEQKKGRGRTHRRTHVIIFSSPEGKRHVSFHAKGPSRRVELVGCGPGAAMLCLQPWWQQEGG